jgi:hypothetical protein
VHQFELLNRNALKTKFSGWKDSPSARTLLKEILLSHDTIMEKEETYEQKLNGSLDSDDTEVNKVKHLGHGVFVQNFTINIVDIFLPLVPCVITRRETRNVSRAVLSRFFEMSNEEKKHAAVVGNPGIGKSRGTLMYTLQILLNAGATIVFMTYGEWVIKSISTLNVLAVANILEIPDVLCLIDPPEGGGFNRNMNCYMIVFSSLSDEKLHNFDKDGDFIYTSPCSNDELCAMIPVLWNEKKSCPEQSFLNNSEIEEEIRKRAFLVGGAPRYIFDFVAFKKRCESIHQTITDKIQFATPTNILQEVIALHSSNVGNIAVSGKLFFVKSLDNPGQITVTKYGKEFFKKRIEYCTFPNPLALGVLLISLERVEDFKRVPTTGSQYGAEFEIFVSIMLKYVTYDVQTQEFHHCINTREYLYLNYNEFFECLKNLDLNQNMILISNSQHFSVLDYALSSKIFIYAKGSKDGNFETKVDDALIFLIKLGILDENFNVLKPGYKARLYFTHNRVEKSLSHEFVKGDKEWGDEFNHVRDIVSKLLIPCFFKVNELETLLFKELGQEALKAYNSYKFNHLF